MSNVVAPQSTLQVTNHDGSPLPGVREGSAVVVTPQGDLAIVADEDKTSLALVTLPIPESAPKVDHVALQGRPASLVLIGTTLLATLREAPSPGEGALVAYELTSGGKLNEAWRTPLPADAWGLAVSPDGAFAAVTSAWTHEVSLVNLATHAVVWSRDVGREPRGVAFTAGGDALLVTHIVEAPITRIDDVHADPHVTTLDIPAAPERAPALAKLTATLAYSIVMSPDRSRAFVPRHALGTVGSFDWNGAATVDAFDVATNTPIATPRQVNAHATIPEAFDYSNRPERIAEYQTIVSDDVAEGAHVFRVPRAAVYRKKNQTILVADEGGYGVVELDALMSDPTLGLVHRYLDPCSAPSGIALSADEATAYVYCRASETLSAIKLASSDGNFVSAYSRYADLGRVSTDVQYLDGRAGFYAACAGCHPEGRDDGHVWHEVHFGHPDIGNPDDKGSFETLFSTATAARHLDSFGKPFEGRTDVASAPKHPDPVNMDTSGAGYARQTPMIVGRVGAEGPYGWHGKDADLPKRVLHGFALHQWPSFGPSSQEPQPDEKAIVAFIRKGLVPPPATHRPLTEEERHGQEVFTSAATECATCHVPSTDYTNRSLAALGAPTVQPSFVADPDTSFKTPSLLFVGGSPPYMHDGRYATLEELIDDNADRMGKTTQLSAADKKALAAFLRTL